MRCVLAFVHCVGYQTTKVILLFSSEFVWSYGQTSHDSDSQQRLDCVGAIRSWLRVQSGGAGTAGTAIALPCRDVSPPNCRILTTSCPPQAGPTTVRLSTKFGALSNYHPLTTVGQRPQEYRKYPGRPCCILRFVQRGTLRSAVSCVLAFPAFFGAEKSSTAPYDILSALFALV